MQGARKQQKIAGGRKQKVERLGSAEQTYLLRRVERYYESVEGLGTPQSSVHGKVFRQKGQER